MTMLPQQMLHTLRLNRNRTTYPGLLKQWCNLKVPFERATGIKCGLDRAMSVMKKPVTGRHHSGLSDCHNTAKILVELLNQDHRPVRIGVTRELDMRQFRQKAAIVWSRVVQDIADEKARAALGGPVRIASRPKPMCKWDDTCRIGCRDADFAKTRHWRNKVHNKQDVPVPAPEEEEEEEKEEEVPAPVAAASSV